MSASITKNNTNKKEDFIVSEIKSLLKALFIVILIRCFIIQPFVIPTGSMIPTLLVGDYIFVTKYDYGYDNVSLPFAPPIFPHRVLANMPKTGDIVVFRGHEHVPHAYDKDFIKRLVGVPGDRIQMKGGILHINGKPCALEEKGPYFYIDNDGRPRNTTWYTETLPNGVKHPVLKEAPFGTARWDNTREFIVPAGHFFFMGDNRDHSWDSRDENFLYFVPFKQVIGRARFIWFSNPATFTPISKAPEGVVDLLTATRWDRVWTALH